MKWERLNERASTAKHENKARTQSWREECECNESALENNVRVTCNESQGQGMSFSDFNSLFIGAVILLLPKMDCCLRERERERERETEWMNEWTNEWTSCVSRTTIESIIPVKWLSDILFSITLLHVSKNSISRMLNDVKLFGHSKESDKRSAK
jgi:hypothetical protein